MSWSRAVWVEGKSEKEGTVPRCWIVEKKLYWPRDRKEEKAAFYKKLLPQSHWYSFDIVKIKMKEGDYETCEAYDFTTADESEVNNPPDDTPENSVATTPAELPIYPESGPSQRVSSPVNFEKNANVGKEGKRKSRGKTHSLKSPRWSPFKNRFRREFSKQIKPSLTSKFKERCPMPSNDTKNGKKVPSFEKKTEEVVQGSSRNSVECNQSSQVLTSSLNESNQELENCLSPIKLCSEKIKKNTVSSTEEHKSKDASSRKRKHLVFSDSEEETDEDNETDFSKDQSYSLKSDSVSTQIVTCRNGAEHNANKFPMTEIKFQKSVIYLLTDIRSLIHSKKYVEDPLNLDGFVLTNCETYEDFLELQERLSDKPFYTSMESSLAKIGGNNLKDRVANMMKRTMKNAVMAKFNMRGRKGTKKAFAETTLYKIIKDVALKTCESATEKEIDIIMGNQLRYAPDRSFGGSRGQSEAEA